MAKRGSTEDLSIDRESMMRDLEEKGYAVIPEVCSAHDCGDYTVQYRRWLSQFDEDDWPFQMQSVIQSYSIGNFKNTWKARLKTKPVFSAIWQTEKLLTSIDGVAISFPPETEKHGIYNTGKDWYHLDQSAERSGLHAYQGALYLEETSDTDYCFRVWPGSHKHHEIFFEEFEGAKRKSNSSGFHKLSGDEKEWFREKGCVPIKVPVPKGGMVVWDSRTVHDNCKPERNRPNSDRWRFVVFVSMTPARWARLEDMAAKRRGYKYQMMTYHWSSQGVTVFDAANPPHHSNVKPPEDISPSKVAHTKEVRLLAGDLDYDFKDGQPNGPDWDPEWKENTNLW